MTGLSKLRALPVLIFALAISTFFVFDVEGQSDGEDLPAFIELSHTHVVNVEVYVTEKDGRPVTGLTADDFEIFENGKPMSVAYFSAVEDGRPTEPIAEAADPADSADSQGSGDRVIPTRNIPGQASSQLPPEQRLHVIVYVDNFNLRPETRNRVLRRLRGFLRTSIRPDDRVMVVSYDRSLHMRQSFTSDMSLVGRAIDQLEELSGSQTTRDNERDLAIQEISGAQDEITALLEARSYAESVSAEMRFTLDAMQRQVEMLSGLEGRKALIYISDGLPQVVGEDLFIYVSERFPRSGARLEAGNFDLGRDYRQMVARANSAGVTFYALEARGMRANRSVSAEFGGTTQGGGLPFIDSVDEANLQEPLYMLADDTGGQTIIGTNAVEAGLGKFLNDFRNYYFLGYSPNHFGDGRYHKIEVKVKRKGLKVRHRNGYRDQTLENRMASSTIATLVHGSEANPLDIEFGFGAYQKEGKTFQVPLEVRIPIGKITLVPQGDNYIGRLKVAVAVMDSEGGMSPVQQQEPLTLSIPRAEIDIARDKYYTYAMVLALRPGLARVALSLRDELSTETSFLRRTVSLGT